MIPASTLTSRRTGAAAEVSVLEQLNLKPTRPVADCKARPSKTGARLLEDSSAPQTECPNGTCTVSFVDCGKRQGLGAGSLRKPTVHAGLVYRTAVFVVVRGVISIADVQPCFRSVIQLDTTATCKPSPVVRLERRTPLAYPPCRKTTKMHAERRGRRPLRATVHLQVHQQEWPPPFSESFAM
ncbi:uncharacterized protein LOC144152690 [Haemaphysalis longicornis]